MPVKLWALTDALDKINLYAEDASALEHLKDLADKLDEKEHLLKADPGYFTDGASPEQVKEDIQAFLQRATSVFERSDQWRTEMLGVLCKLAFLEIDNFGHECFKAMIDAMKTDKEVENAVEDAIEYNIIMEIAKKDEPPTEYPVALLEDICEFVLAEPAQYAKRLRSLYNICFPAWLEEIKEKIDSYDERRRCNDAIVKLLSASVRDVEEGAENCI